MHVLMFEPRFVPLIESGAKMHTIRGDRKRVIRVGDELSLRCWEGKPYRSKQREIFRGPCLAKAHGVVLTLRMISIVGLGRRGVHFKREQLEEFAKSDGFATWREMREYWEANGGLNVADQIILWGVHPLFESAFHKPVALTK